MKIVPQLTTAKPAILFLALLSVLLVLPATYGAGPRKADLTVSSMAFSPQSPLPTDTVRISVTVTNIGNAKAGKSGLNVYGTDFSYSINVSPMAPGTSQTFQLTAGPYNASTAITANADYLNKIAESNEANNALTKTIIVQAIAPTNNTNATNSTGNFSGSGSITGSAVSSTALPDLTVVNLTVNPSPVPDWAGFPQYNMSANVTNLGAPTTIDAFVRLETNVLSEPIRIPPMAKGDYIIVSVIAGATNNQSFYFSAEADPGDWQGNDRITESNEHNNKMTMEVGEHPRSCTESDGGLNYALRGFVTGDRFSTIDRCDWRNSSVLVEFTCKGNSNVLETKYFCAGGCRDGACPGAPSDPTVNKSDDDKDKEKKDKVKKLADLTASVSISPASPLPNQTVSVLVTITNVGSHASPAQKSTVQVLGIPTEFKLPAIIPNASRYFRVTAGPFRPGNYNATAVADADDKVSEASESNNVGVKTFTVQSRPLVVPLNSDVPNSIAVNGKWIQSNNIIRAIDYGVGGHAILLVDADRKYRDFRYLAKLAGNNGEAGLCGRMNASGYGFCFGRGWVGGDVVFEEYRGYPWNPAVIQVSGRSVVNATSFYIELAMDGNVIKGKAWAEGQEVPADYTLTRTLSNVAPEGHIGLYTYYSPFSFERKYAETSGLNDTTSVLPVG